MTNYWSRRYKYVKWREYITLRQKKRIQFARVQLQLANEMLQRNKVGSNFGENNYANLLQFLLCVQ